MVFPPTLKDLEDRLKLRGTEKESVLKTRLENAKVELKKGLLSPNLIDYNVLNTNDLKRSTNIFTRIIKGLY